MCFGRAPLGSRRAFAAYGKPYCWLGDLNILSRILCRGLAPEIISFGDAFEGLGERGLRKMHRFKYRWALPLIALRVESPRGLDRLLLNRPITSRKLGLVGSTFVDTFVGLAVRINMDECVCLNEH
jgi:hypothetical protein